MSRRDTDTKAADTISRKVARKQAAERKDPHRAVWFGFGMFGLVGWAVAVPTLIGVALGLWLDRSAPGEFSWTLALLLAGVALGCLNAWYWVSKEAMMTADLWAAPWTPVLALLLGAGFAALYLRLVRHSAEALVQGDAGPGRAVLGLSLRLLLALAALGLAVWAGAGPADLLAGALGFTLMRTILLRRVAGRE